MKLDFDGDDIVYKNVSIVPWLYRDEILYSLDDKYILKNITNDCSSISEAISIIDKYRFDEIPKNNNHNFKLFVDKFKKDYKDSMYYNFGNFRQILYQSNKCSLLAVSSHSKELPDAVTNRANGAIVICKGSSMHWNSEANKIFEFPRNNKEYNAIISYIENMDG